MLDTHAKFQELYRMVMKRIEGLKYDVISHINYSGYDDRRSNLINRDYSHIKVAILTA